MELNTYYKGNLTKSSYNLTDISLNFLNRIKDTLIFFQSFITYMFIGTIMLSTVGEYILYSFAHEQPRSLLAVSEKFPSDFRVITGKRGIGNKSNEMVGEDKDIISLRCVTKSCTMVRDIEKCIYRQYEKNREKEEEQENTTLDYRIIKAPWERVIEDFNKSANTIPFSLGSIFRIIRGENYAKKYKEEYERRLKILAKLEDKGNVKVKDFYFGDIRFLIVVDSSGDKKLLFSARGGGPMMDRVGLYTEEPYIVESFANLFDTSWRKTNNLL